MTEEPEKLESDTPEDAPAPETRADASVSDAEAASSAASAADETSAEAVADEPAATPETEEKPKPKRRRAAKPKAEATQAETEKPAKAAKPAKAEPAKPAKAAPARRRRREQPAGPAPVVRAQAKYVRSSARKARLVCDHIRGKSVLEARAILAHTPRAIARDWSKLLESAVANAEHNHSLDGEDLYVKAVHADEGPTIKRFRPRAMGRATKIRKRTTHLTILLTPKD
jgi:large subunit ribosomal protein L22